MKTHSLFSKIVSGSLLIAGTTIGAGMLGIPLITHQSGFFCAVIVTLVVWLFMLLTGFLLLKATLWMPDHSSFLSLSKHFLGKSGEGITGFLFVFLYYCLMIAYFAAGSHILSDLVQPLLPFSMPLSGIMLLFGLIVFVVVVISPKSIDRVNIVLSLAMFVFLFAMLFKGAPYVQKEQLCQGSAQKMVWALPLLFGAFGYHNIIPSIASYLERDRKALKLSIFIGATIPLVIYLAWQWLIMGVLPNATIEEARLLGYPVTSALKSFTHSPYIFLLGQMFALLAIVTSVLGVSFSLVDFLADGFKKAAKGTNRLWLSLLTIAPPMLIAMGYPAIFTQALSIAGGFGEALLNGILPIALVFSGCYLIKKPHAKKGFGGRLTLLLLTLFALGVIVVEVFHLIHH